MTDRTRAEARAIHAWIARARAGAAGDLWGALDERFVTIAPQIADLWHRAGAAIARRRGLVDVDRARAIALPPAVIYAHLAAIPCDREAAHALREWLARGPLAGDELTVDVRRITRAEPAREVTERTTSDELTERAARALASARPVLPARERAAVPAPAWRGVPNDPGRAYYALEGTRPIAGEMPRADDLRWLAAVRELDAARRKARGRAIAGAREQRARAKRARAAVHLRAAPGGAVSAGLSRRRKRRRSRR